jgi:hypothetical protein
MPVNWRVLYHKEKGGTNQEGVESCARRSKVHGMSCALHAFVRSCVLAYNLPILPVSGAKLLPPRGKGLAGLPHRALAAGGQA